MADPSKLHAMINARCPHCHEGRLFKYKWWNLLNFAQMHENCPHCDVRYEVEPGFFYGAMYISYAFTVGIMLIGGLIVFNFLLHFKKVSEDIRFRGFFNCINCHGHRLYRKN